MPIDPQTVRRLAFVKYLHRLGTEQSLSPEPESAASVLTWHDAIELFLQIASEYLDAGGQNPSFLEYWELLSDKLPKTLPHKESMRRLNKARIALKHHGTMPSKIDLEAFRVSSNSFLQDSSVVAFGISYSEISLVEFVDSEVARKNLKEAEASLGHTEFEDAIDKSALAFQQVIRHYEDQMKDRFGRSPFYFGSDMAFLDSFWMGLKSGPSPVMANQDFQRKLGEFVDNVKESLETMQEAIKIIALGIDYSKYSTFRRLTPTVRRLSNSKLDLVKGSRRDMSQYNSVNARFCIDFVIDTSLALRETVPSQPNEPLDVA